MPILKTALKHRVLHPVLFEHYRDGALWYRACDNWLFPVPIGEAGTGTFGAVVKGILLMRWMRKHMDTETGYVPDEFHDGGSDGR
jgi:hypothetical protein